MKKYIVRTKVREVNNLWCLLGTYSAKLYGHIYVVSRKFLWWQLRPRLVISIYTPYLKDPTYNGEYATNRILAAEAKELRAELEVEKDRIQRRLDRLLIRKPLSGKK